MNYQSITMAANATDNGHRFDSPEQAGSAIPGSSEGHEERSPGYCDDVSNPELEMERSSRTSPQSFTPRSLFVGLVIGALITFSNTYFGLQTGWISTMAMPSALIGFSVFKVFSKYLSYPFTPIENVLIQTVAGAVGTMPLGCGFVGVIPALEFLVRDGEDGPSGDGGTGEGGPLKLNFWKLVLWSLGVCLFGVVFAVPLRKEVIVREKLRFPSGTASALMLRVLHGSGSSDEKVKKKSNSTAVLRGEGQTLALTHETGEEEGNALLQKDDSERQLADRRDWRSKMRLLVGAFAVSGVYVRSPAVLNRGRDTNCDRPSSPTLSLKSVMCPSSVFL